MANHQLQKQEAVHTAIEVTEDKNSRGNWSNQCEFFLSCLGFAVGFGNVWRFPYLAFKNGGAAFLIPYTIMLLIAGLPMFFLELAIGQYVSLGPNILFEKMVPMFSGVGWAMVFVTILVSIYYNMILCWSLFYVVSSFTSILPWGSCRNYYNRENCFSEQDARECRNMSLIFYNKSCVDSPTMCSLAGVDHYNETHCTFMDNGTSILRNAEYIVPRISASEDFFQSRMLGIPGKTWEDMGTLRWELVGYLALAWLIVGGSLVKGIQTLGKVVYFTALFPYAVLIILFVRGVTLPGAGKGIEFYILKPNMTKLAEVEVWMDAATQIFYSLSVSFGGLITLASYNKFTSNCMRDAILVSLFNCGTSVFAGFVIFSILGFISQELNVEIADVASSGSGLAFVAYPAAVVLLPVPPLWSILFFTMFITLGLDSQFTFVETVTTAIFDSYIPLRKKKPIVVGIVSLLMFLAALTMCLEGGAYMFELFNYYAVGLSVLFISICEIFCVIYIYGIGNIFSHLKEMGISVPRVLKFYWTVTWCFLTPLSLIGIFVFSIYYFTPATWGKYVYPYNIQILGGLLIASTISIIPFFMLWKFLRRGEKSLRDLFKPTPTFCPEHIREARKKSKEPTTFGCAYENKGFQESEPRLMVYTVYPPPSYENYLARSSL